MLKNNTIFDTESMTSAIDVSGMENGIRLVEECLQLSNLPNDKANGKYETSRNWWSARVLPGRTCATQSCRAQVRSEFNADNWVCGAFQKCSRLIQLQKPRRKKQKEKNAARRWNVCTRIQANDCIKICWHQILLIDRHPDSVVYCIFKILDWFSLNRLKLETFFQKFDNLIIVFDWALNCYISNAVESLNRQNHIWLMSQWVCET